MRTVTYVLGASGSGKSTRAHARHGELLAAGEPTLLVSTDVVRAQLRAVLDREAHPDLWAESFDTPAREGDELRATTDGSGQQVDISGFLRQGAPIVACAEAAVDYALGEGWNCVVEGVHLVPGTFALPAAPDLAVRVELCEPRSSEAHRANFSERDAASSGGRPAEHYHANLARIEVVAAYLRERWNAWVLPEGVERHEVRTGR